MAATIQPKHLMSVCVQRTGVWTYFLSPFFSSLGFPLPLLLKLWFMGQWHRHYPEAYRNAGSQPTQTCHVLTRPRVQRVHTSVQKPSSCVQQDNEPGPGHREKLRSLWPKLFQQGCAWGFWLTCWEER